MRTAVFDNGIPEFKEAAAQYLANVYGVKNIDPSNSSFTDRVKAILAMLPVCFINPGDILLTTVPDIRCAQPIRSTWAAKCTTPVA